MDKHSYTKEILRLWSWTCLYYHINWNYCSYATNWW